MTKLVLEDFTQLSSNESAAVSRLNANNDAIVAALEKTLSRDGTAPNQMTADLDLNSNDLLNASTVYTQRLYIGGTPVTTATDLVSTNDVATLSDIASLRATTSAVTTQDTVIVNGWYSGSTYGGGTFVYDNSDVASTDDSGLVIVDASNRRWKRLWEGTLRPVMFGAVGDGGTDDTTAWNLCITAAKSLVAAGRYQLVIDGGGFNYGVSATLTFNTNTSDLIVQNCQFTALGVLGDWTESDTTVTTYWLNYQTYGASWTTQKPVLKIGTSNPGFQLVNVTVLGNDVAAGIYILGNNKGRGLFNVGIDGVRSYGIFQTGSCKLDNIKIRVKTSAAATPRNSYGLAYDAVDTHWNNVTAQWAHCPLLTTGATLMMTDCDLFNGIDGAPVADPRLWEHRGNTVTFQGGRLGNGVIHCWSSDLAILSTKIGITSAATIADYFKFYATEAGQKLENFLFLPSELPQELSSGSTDFVSFQTPTTFTANTSNGNATITNVSSVANLHIGQVVAGTNIQVGSTIASINSVAGTITLSATCTGAGTGITVTPAGSWDSNTTTVLNSRNGYWSVIPRGLSLVATEGNNAYPQELINAALANSLLRFRAGGSSVVPEVGLRSDKLFLGITSSLGWAVGSTGELLNGTGGTAFGLYSGAGSPEGVITARVGSLYLRSDGGAGTTLYVKQSGTGNTGWIGK